MNKNLFLKEMRRNAMSLLAMDLCDHPAGLFYHVGLPDIC